MGASSGLGLVGDDAGAAEWNGGLGAQGSSVV